MQLQECINFKLTSTQNVVFNYFRGKLAVLDVTPIQYALLKCLWTEDMQTPSQLAQTLRLDASSITGILDRLEKKTLVERVYSRQDRRSVQVHLLESGAALQKPIEAIIRDANADVLAGIGEEDYKRLLSLLELMEANVKSHQ